MTSRQCVPFARYVATCPGRTSQTLAEGALVRRTSANEATVLDVVGDDTAAPRASSEAAFPRQNEHLRAL
jgi:hypothetical protein